jgi:hypothetical protein
MTDQGPPDPEQLPPTHQAYGDRKKDNPFTSPSGPAAQPSGPDYVAPSSQPPPPTYQQYSPQQPMYGPPPVTPYGYGGPTLPEHPQVGTAFVLGLVSLIGGFACGLPIVAGPFAWVMGARVRKEIDASPGQYGGREKATAAMVMGMVATGFLALALLVVFIAVVAIVASA